MSDHFILSETKILQRNFKSRDSVIWEDSESESNDKTSLDKEGKRYGFNFVGCALLYSLRLNLSYSRIIKTKVKPRPKFGVTKMLNLRGFRFGSEDGEWSVKDEVDEIFVLSNVIQVKSFYTTWKAI